MRTIRWVPGAIVAGNNVTIPTTAPDIDEVVAAEITRLPLGLCGLADHLEANILATLGDHPEADVAATLGAHTLTPDATLATTNALGEDGAGALETAAVGAVGMPTCINAHAGSGVPNDLAHAVSGVPNDVAHGAGTDPVAAAVPTRVDTRTLTLDVNTLLGDLLTLSYLEVGERVLVS